MVSGVNSEGFRTILFPANNPSIVPFIAVAREKFQGEIIPTTPNGSYLTYAFLFLNKRPEFLLLFFSAVLAIYDIDLA